MNAATQVESLPLGDLVPYPNNPRTHPPANVKKLAESLQEYGWTSPVLITAQNEIIAGHGRVLAAKELGLPEVPCIRLAQLTEAQVRAYRIADNRLGLDSDWDLDLLKLEFEELDLESAITGFDELELDRILTDTGPKEGEDDAPPLEKEAVSKMGEIWALEAHRLICADACNAAEVARLLGGVKPLLMVTDPPYGVRLDPTWRDRTGANTLAKAERSSRNYLDGGSLDTEARWDGAWKLSPADVFYVFCAAGPLLIDAAKGLGESGFELRQILVWDKCVLTLTRTHYWYGHEHILYGVRKGKTAHWVGANGQSSVWSVPSPKHIMGGSKEKKEAHPAQRPVECMRRPIENNSNPGQAVYDPFMGSGTTIIAAETIGRVCYGVEINPLYVDMAIRRWQNFTGKTATRVGDNKPFDG
jgi:DNA modification methylase